MKLFVRSGLEVYFCQIRLMRARGKSVLPFQPLESIAWDILSTCKYVTSTRTDAVGRIVSLYVFLVWGQVGGA